MIWKVSHEDANEVAGFIEWLKTNHEDEEVGKMKATRGKVHEHLGMTLDFQKKGAVKIKMLDCVESMADDFARKLKEKVTKQAAEHLQKGEWELWKPGWAKGKRIPWHGSPRIVC